jgi:hypothetical protein
MSVETSSGCCSAGRVTSVQVSLTCRGGGGRVSGGGGGTTVGAGVFFYSFFSFLEGTFTREVGTKTVPIRPSPRRTTRTLGHRMRLVRSPKVPQNQPGYAPRPPLPLVTKSGGAVEPPHRTPLPWPTTPESCWARGSQPLAPARGVNQINDSVMPGTPPSLLWGSNRTLPCDRTIHP